MENIRLYYQQGGSDKVYQAAIEPEGARYVVTFAYGRRGTTLQVGTKTGTAVEYEAARAIYDKLVKEKLAKGYTIGQSSTPYQHSEKTSTGIHCQLLNPIEEDQLHRLIADPGFWAQEKYDGRRLLIRKQGDVISGINRLGFTAALPEALSQCAGNCEVDFIIDGEAIGDMLCVFDCLLIGDEDLRGLRYGERYLRLMNLLGTFAHPNLHLVETHFLKGQKQKLVERLKTDNAEGVVFKDINASYIAGRSASSGFKYKFVETASFLVGKINSKRSVSLLLFDGDRLKDMGNVTIPPNQEIPDPMSIVEVRYLYAFKGGSVFQPVYLGVRDDLTKDDCTIQQLKFKAETVAAAA